MTSRILLASVIIGIVPSPMVWSADREDCAPGLCAQQQRRIQALEAERDRMAEELQRLRAEVRRLNETLERLRSQLGNPRPGPR